MGASCRSFASSSATNHTSYAVDAVSPPTLAVVSCVSDRSDVTLPAFTASPLSDVPSFTSLAVGALAVSGRMR